MTRTCFALAGLFLAGGLLAVLSAAVPARAQDQIIAPGASKAQIDQFFQGIDSDKNGVISYPEFAAKQQARFASLDTDRNGSLSLAEFTAEAASNPTKLERQQKRLVALDQNGDGSLTPAEFEAPRKQQFDAMDANCDGQVSVEEFGATVRTKPLPKSC
ncbi:MAG: EF-hand domain-containing protein [Pseudomonadota bacterium]